MSTRFFRKLGPERPICFGAMEGSWKPDELVAWVRHWSPPPKTVDEKFIGTLKRIFKECILAEVRNVIKDVQKSRKDLQHRGHVIAIGLLCALDAIALMAIGDTMWPN